MHGQQNLKKKGLFIFSWIGSCLQLHLFWNCNYSDPLFSAVLGEWSWRAGQKSVVGKIGVTWTRTFVDIPSHKIHTFLGITHSCVAWVFDVGSFRGGWV